MENNDFSSSRRGFLGAIASGAAAIGATTLATPISMVAAPVIAHNVNNPEEWFNKIKGKHRVVFDAPRPHEIFPFAWPRVFLLTNAGTGTQEKDCSVVVVLRHDAIPYAMQSELWEKYHFGEVFKADDPKTKAPATRNPFWKPEQGEYKVPGFGAVAVGINELQERGEIF
jgi:hypothetical protein